MIPLGDPKTLLVALVGGMIPSLIWLSFWLGEDSRKPEPKTAIATIFLIGMMGVLVVIPIQKLIQSIVIDPNLELVLWASAEEFVKLIFTLLIIIRSGVIDEPTDWPIYLITAALGFAALENTLFLIKPLSLGETTAGLLNGQLRFLGSTLLHSITAAIIGISMGLSLHMRRWIKKIYLIGGFIIAVVLHSAFNFFIIRNNGENVLQVLAFLWVAAIAVMLIFEKLRRVNN